MYSVLTVALHPLTVVKIRNQVGVSTADVSSSISGGTLSKNLKQYYRGLGVVISLAIPTRIIYISTLEYTRELIEKNARNLILNPPLLLAKYDCQLQNLAPLITAFSGGVSGGLAAVSSQLIVVPMDVISQKQMVMEDSIYKKRGSAIIVVKTVLSSDGWRGIYRGFGLSLFTSLPAGSIWWATYAGSKDYMSVHSNSNDNEGNTIVNSFPLIVRQGLVQIASAFSAAIMASIMTQPLDTIKTRLQVGGKPGNLPSKSAIISVAKELTATSGFSGMYQGLLPRIAHMGIWGSVLSSAYEYLKLVSRKDYNS